MRHISICCNCDFKNTKNKVQITKEYTFIVQMKPQFSMEEYFFWVQMYNFILDFKSAYIVITSMNIYNVLFDKQSIDLLLLFL